MAEKYLRQDALAERWQISPRTLERWRWSGDGPVFLKIGGRVLVPRTAIDELLNGDR